MDANIRIAPLSKGDPCKPCDSEFQECDSYIINKAELFSALATFFPSSSQTDRLKQANLKKQKITFGQCDRETQKIKP